MLSGESAIGAPGRIVIRAPNWLGDAVMALPAMAALRLAFRDAKLAVAALPSLAPLFEERTSAGQDEVVSIPDGRREADILRTGRFDTAVLLPNSFRSAWAARQADIPGRWGYRGNLRGWMLTKGVARPRRRIHQSTYYLELIRGLGISTPDEPPRVEATPATSARAAAVLEKAGVHESADLVAFAPGAANGHAKRWPPARAAELMTRLTRERGVACLMLGGPQDRGAGREIESLLPADVRAVNLIGRTDLRLLVGLLQRCEVLVSNDSGGMHLAAAVNVPVVAIFGPTDERVTAPLGDHDVLIHDVFCRPCMLRDCPIDHRCMTRISVESVFAAVARRLEARA